MRLKNVGRYKVNKVSIEAKQRISLMYADKNPVKNQKNEEK
jgi:hypothetical protein